jgi:hypothetical protein
MPIFQRKGYCPFQSSRFEYVILGHTSSDKLGRSIKWSVFFLMFLISFRQISVRANAFR